MINWIASCKTPSAAIDTIPAFVNYKIGDILLIEKLHLNFVGEVVAVYEGKLAICHPGCDQKPVGIFEHVDVAKKISNSVNWIKREKIKHYNASNEIYMVDILGTLPTLSDGEIIVSDGRGDVQIGEVCKNCNNFNCGNFDKRSCDRHAGVLFNECWGKINKPDSVKQ